MKCYSVMSVTMDATVLDDVDAYVTMYATYHSRRKYLEIRRSTKDCLIMVEFIQINCFIAFETFDV